ncbi:MAG: alkaline phosphatase family protein [Gammaproteobacteria bacterium]
MIIAKCLRAAAPLLVALVFSFSLPANAATATQLTPPRPKLVLQITVDQLRGDLLPRFHGRFGQGGFRLLMERGVYFANAHYETANTLTCAGHAVLVTGADVGEHGIVGNDWYDRDTGSEVYCVDDSRYPAVGEPAKAGKGMSPANLTSTTVGDELVSASGGKSRAFAVSGKDRSAIVPGGHRGKSFWFSGITGGMASSRYYYTELPAWAQAWNERKVFTHYRDGWALSRPLESYVNRSGAENPYAHPKADLGPKFPHALNIGGDAGLINGIRYTPFLDEVTADFARELIDKEKLGGSGVADYLSISFSSTDYVGHTYGPNSVEAEDNLIRLDATLAKLFAFVDKTVGLKNTVIVLSADHGVDDIPEERKGHGYDAERFGGDELRAKLNASLRQRLDVKVDLVAAVIPPGVYFDPSKLRETKLEPAVAESALAQALRELSGVAYAFTRTDLMAGRVAGTPLLNRVQRAFHPKRSGDVVVVQKQFYFLDEDPGYYAAMHGSPYSYDTFVPVAVLAPGVAGTTSYEAVAPGQIAPTLAALLGIKAPSGCSCGAPLPHVLPR